MNVKEKIYNTKKKIIKLYKMYFTIEGIYTSILPDYIYIKKMYEKRLGEKLDLKNPHTFVEKLNWLKLYDRRNIYTIMADKYESRKLIAEKWGTKYLVPLINSWCNVEEIDFEALPNQFVLKCNHDNGVIIVKDKEKIDIEKIKKELYFHLNRDYYKKCREWPYKNIPRKIICEKFMENTLETQLVDYKIFCFNGEPKFIMVNSDRFSESGVKVDMYDMNWNHMNMQDGPYPMSGKLFNKPECFDEMIVLSKIISKKIPFLRVDFNVWDNQLYYGELTFFHSAGFEKFRPTEWDEILGEWLDLPFYKNK